MYCKFLGGKSKEHQFWDKKEFQKARESDLVESQIQ